MFINSMAYAYQRTLVSMAQGQTHMASEASGHGPYNVVSSLVARFAIVARNLERPICFENKK